MKLATEAAKPVSASRMSWAVHYKADQWGRLILIERIRAEGGAQDLRLGAWASLMRRQQPQGVLGPQGQTGRPRHVSQLWCPSVLNVYVCPLQTECHGTAHLRDFA